MLRARAFARVGLIGNPSDGYGGRAIGFALAGFAAEVTLRSGSPPRDGLLGAARTVFAERYGDPGDAALCLRTNIPRQVGLSGSSAIVVAALRALAMQAGVELPPGALAWLALRAETEVLGLAAGPLDRVVQVLEGLLWMDFREPLPALSVERLDPGLLPPMFLAWDPAIGASSGEVHGRIRARWEAGDPAVRAAMDRFPELADRGLACLRSGDFAGLAAAMDESFDTRAAVWELGERDLRLVALGREHGAGVKLAGSGGAVIGVLPDEALGLEAAYRAEGFEIIRPMVAGST